MEKPYKILWFCTPFFWLISLLFPNDRADIQLHDTYIALAPIHLAMIFCLIPILTGFIYYIFNNTKLLNWMTKVHVFGTLLISFALIFLLMYNAFNEMNNYGFHKVFVTSIILLVASYVFCQLIFIVNILLNSIKNEKI